MTKRATKEERREAYAEKIEGKRDRFLERAEKAANASSAAFRGARAMGAMIPMGQPILVGHHSEKRHRRDLARIDAGISKGIELDSKAKHYANRAENYGASGAISADNPDAVELLRAKIETLQARRESYKDANKKLGVVYRKAKKALGGDPATVGQWTTLINALDISEEIREAMLGGLRFSISYSSVKFTYKLTNLGATIRAAEKRCRVLEAEEKRAEEPAQEISGAGFTVEECPDDNRLRFFFDGKPSAEIRKIMKGNGFRWSPTAGAWQRQLNENGRYAAKRVASLIESAEA